MRIRKKHWSSGWTTAVIALLVSAGAVAPSAQGRGDKGPQRRAERVDRHLAERLDQGDGNDRERVIITLKPGAKRQLLQQMQAAGERADQDFGVIDAVATRLPRRVLRQLRNHPDVVSMSVDADVAPMSVAGVSGAALGAPYTLRTTLGLESTTSAPASIATLATTTAKGAGVSSLSWSHTVAAGTNRLLLVTTTHRDGNKQVSAVTYGGVALTAHVSAGTGENRAGIYYLVNPPVGTATVHVAMSSGGHVAAAATTFTGVDPVTPLSAGASSTGSGTSASVALPSAADSVVISAVAANGDAGSLTLLGSGTSLWSDGTGSVKSNIRGAGATRPGGGTFSVGRTLSSSKPWSIVAAALQPGQIATQTAATSRTGAGVTVAVIDSGMFLDGGAASRLKTTRDFTTASANPPAVSARDGYGHGTHVAGLIGSNQTEIKGVAPGVSYVSLRVLDNYGVGATSNVINAVQWAIANKATYGIDVINLSLGHPIFEPAATDPLVQAVEAAVRAGIVVVTSAGNMGTNPLTGQVGYAGISSPGNAPSAITVGAVKTFDTTTPRRRPGGRLQLARADVVRRLRQAGRRGPRPSPAGAHLLDADALLPPGHAARHARRPGLPDAERHQHGRRRHERIGGADDRGRQGHLRRQAHRQRREGDAAAHGVPDARRRQCAVSRPGAGRRRREHRGRRSCWRRRSIPRRLPAATGW